MKRLFALLALGALLGAGLSEGYLAQESRLYERDSALQRLGRSLDDWLTGRSSHRGLRDELQRLRTPLGLSGGPDGVFGRELSKLDLATLAEIQGFLELETPTGEQQRGLFQRLGALASARQKLCLEQRRQADLGQLKGAEPKLLRFLRWELSWIDLWMREVELTEQLQTVLLREKSVGAEGQELVRELLRLQTQAGLVATPEELSALQDLSVERLTLLVRTAEQAARKQAGDARGALLQIRRLGRQLDDNAERFRNARREQLGRLSGLS